MVFVKVYICLFYILSTYNAVEIFRYDLYQNTHFYKRNCLKEKSTYTNNNNGE